MKTWTLLLASVGFLTFGTSLSQAQNYVLESKVAVVAAVTTQGTETTRSLRGGAEVTRLGVTVKPFTNREILAEMSTRTLLDGSTSGWSLVYLMDAQQQGGIYASKSGIIPVPVPEDLVTLPTYSVGLQTGTQTQHPGGATYSALTELALASAQVRGLSVSGFASNGIRSLTVKVQGSTYLVDTVSSKFNFTGGGEGESGAELLKGSISIGSAKLSTLSELP
ncbi:hypothetical protein SAMN02745166_04948 [Prosthecobacter debontii]|uniref:Uncharacterized protein n=1 Tax=Prosthecobacter debontii TaxID=48467 RepID=A0A1T4Z338_9BACT|nr:hypothetical protein [Prosthecobacter debontii]SKB08467.1 hypothetical protein SAMN02745166_04948 [Prosthecobacter debontii]